MEYQTDRMCDGREKMLRMIRKAQDERADLESELKGLISQLPAEEQIPQRQTMEECLMHLERSARDLTELLEHAETAERIMKATETEVASIVSGVRV